MLKSIIKTDQTTSSTDPLLNSVIPSTSSASTSTTTALATAAPMKKDNLDDPFTMLGTNSLAGTSYDPNQHDDDNHRSISRQSSVGNLAVMTQSVAGSQLYPALPKTLNFENILTKSDVYDEDSTKQQQKILDKFNRHNGVALNSKEFVSFGIRGELIPSDSYKIFHRNQVAFLVAPSKQKVATALWVNTPGVVNEEVGTYAQNERYISAHGVHIINVPPGFIAKITDGNSRKLLDEGTHVIHSGALKPLTKDDFVEFGQPYIRHANLHILRVPVGMIARVNTDNLPKLLEGRAEPYVFKNATFELIRKNANELYHAATDRIIEHGTIKRLMPKEGEVAITYKGGNLEILRSDKTGCPITLDDANHSVPKDPFLQVNTYTITFPEAKEYAHATTKDGIPVRMKMMVTFQITNPELAVNSLAFGGVTAHDAILEHIEKCAMTDMRRATQNNNFYEAQESTRNHASSSTDIATKNAPRFFSTVQDEVYHNLFNELLEKGIKLERLFFDEFDCTDSKVQATMAEAAKKTQETYSQVALLQQQALLDRETAQRQVLVSRIQKEGELERARIDVQQQLVIAEGKANQDAAAVRIQQEQANKNILSKAQMELEAAKIRAEALLVTAKAEAEAIRMKGEAESSMQRLLATLVLDNPAYLQLLIAEQQAKALTGVHGMVVSPDVARSVYAVGTPAFFTQPAPGLTHAAVGQGMQMPPAQQPK